MIGNGSLMAGNAGFGKVKFIQSTCILFFILPTELLYYFFSQISTTDMFISWDSFEDVEEFQTISHSSGIQNYMLGIGNLF